MQAACAPCSVPLASSSSFLHGDEYRPRPLKEGAPRIGKRNLPGASIRATPTPNSASKPFDLHAQRRLAHAQPLGGPPEVALLGHRDEVAELAQFHELICNLYQ